MTAFLTLAICAALTHKAIAENAQVLVKNPLSGEISSLLDHTGQYALSDFSGRADLAYLQFSGPVPFSLRLDFARYHQVMTGPFSFDALGNEDIKLDTSLMLDYCPRQDTSGEIFIYSIALDSDYLTTVLDADLQIMCNSNPDHTRHVSIRYGLDRASLPGDVDGNGIVNFYDIDPFVQAISDPYLVALTYVGHPAVLQADANMDGRVDFVDIDALVARLSNRGRARK